MKKIYFLLLMVLGVSGVWGQVSMVTTGSYNQNFNTLIISSGATWTDNSTVPNWYSQRTGTGTSIFGDDGTTTNGFLFSYGTGGSSERALGAIGSGNVTVGNFAHGILLQNNSGAAITDIQVSFTGEQWRNSGAASQTVSFYYKISTSSFTALDPNVNGTWTSVGALNFSSPKAGGAAGPLNGNLAANRVTLTNISIPTLSLAAGSYIMLKWDDPDHTGLDHGLAIDDVTISWVVPPTVTSFTPTSGYSGSTVVITGTNFTGATAVQFDGINAASFVVDNSTQITAVVGAGGTGIVAVTAGGAGASASNFTYNGYITTTGGTWNTGSTWLGGNVPATNSNATLANDVTLDVDPVLNNVLLAGGNVIVGSNNIIANSVTGASSTSYIKTNGSGGLTIKNVTTTTTFPVGNGSSYTPVTITNNGTIDNFSVNVAAGTPCDADPLQSVNRVWTISEATPGGSVADITMQWNSSDENVSFVRAFCEAVHCAGGTVDIQSPKSIAGGSDPYTQTITGISAFSPFGVTSAVIALPISIEYLHASKQGTNHNLAWKVNCTSTPSVKISLERSSNGRDFSSIYNITATAVQCQQAFAYTDAAPFAGVNYYRLKMTDVDGKFSYSSIVTLLNAIKGFELINIAPNPVVGGNFKLNITAAQQTKMTVIITDMVGKVVSQEEVTLIAGFNGIDMNVTNLAAGTYQLYGNTADGKTKALSFVKQ